VPHRLGACPTERQRLIDLAVNAPRTSDDLLINEKG